MITPIQSQLLNAASPVAPQTKAEDKHDPAAREAFRQFVGEAVFGQMIGEMRKSVGKSAYFNGGRAEEIFQGQLDQQLATEVAKSSAERFADPMFELFMMQQRS